MEKEGNIGIVVVIVIIIVIVLIFMCSLLIHLFIITFPEKKIDYSSIINEECGVVKKTTVSDISDLSVVTRNTPESLDIPNYALALKTGDYHNFFHLVMMLLYSLNYDIKNMKLIKISSYTYSEDFIDNFTTVDFYRSHQCWVLCIYPGRLEQRME